MKTCEYVQRNGAKKGTLCGKRLRTDGDFCWSHKKYDIKKIEPIEMKDKSEEECGCVQKVEEEKKSSPFIQLVNSS